MKEIRTAQELLESMTPGGSEFASDPEACAKWVRDYIDNLEHNVKRLVHQRNEVTQKLYHLLDILADAPELLELAAVAVSKMACEHCPCVYGSASERYECSAFHNGARDTWPCYTAPTALRELAQGLRAAGMGENRDT